MKKSFILLIGFLFFYQGLVFAQQNVKKVVFQAFWWDYWNSNFKNKWSDYLTELAPRLRAAGVDAIWIPPSGKANNTSSVGYNPFDPYDLGDKYQKGGSDSLNVRTRLGSKDELLRMIAVFHANGIEVIQDVVLNHTNDAGTNTGTGGKDPQSPYSIANAGGYKNFRFVSYATPLLDESQNDYFTRAGRWPKNYTNFYPNQFNNCTTGDICSPFFGPDVSYESNATGYSSNIPRTGTATIGTIKRNYVNPLQASNYMRNNARNWLMWLKKQTGVDGWRWDAVKHFPTYVQEDLIYNTKYILPNFSKGGESMFNVGEWVGGKTDLDNYVTAVKSGTEEHTGTFDFSLRGYGANGGIYGMIASGGAFNMQNLPSDQQNKRYYDYSTQRVHRTVPFVNSHDTYRPYLSATGNFLKPLGDATGWNTGQELGGNGQHIDPRDPRLFAAYAVSFSMDGNPCVYFEDLFDIGTTGKRYSHFPSSQFDLPIRLDIQNIMQSHQALGFKDGNYAVATALSGTQAPFYSKGSAGDHLVIERTGKAIIGITDKYAAVADNSMDEEVWVSVSGTQWRDIDLIDYSGAHGLTTTRVYSDGRVLIKTAPVGHTISGALGHGYSVWAPVPTGVTFKTVNDLYAFLSNYNPPRKAETTQEWEMADDLGDSHAKSLRQGGMLPANSTATRTVGRIYVAAGKSITCLLFPEINGRSQRLSINNASGVSLANISGVSSNTAPLTLRYTPLLEGWYTIVVNNTLATVSAQKAWVNVTYTAPPIVNTRVAARGITQPIAQDLSTEIDQSLVMYPNPTTGAVNIFMKNASAVEKLQCSVSNIIGNQIGTYFGTLSQIEGWLTEIISTSSKGVYLINLFNEKKKYTGKLLKK